MLVLSADQHNWLPCSFIGMSCVSIKMNLLLQNCLESRVMRSTGKCAGGEPGVYTLEESCCFNHGDPTHND